MSSIFIAHSSKDKPFARRLAADLSASGVRVWLDEAEILVGDSLIEKIQKAILEMDHFAVVLSPHSVKSKWVKKELEAAFSKVIAGTRTKILPILHKECNIPLFLRGMLWADFTTETRYEIEMPRLLKTLAPKPKDFSKIFVEWTPKAVRLAMNCALIDSDIGRVQLSKRYRNNLVYLGKQWFNCKLAARTPGEFSMHVLGKTLACDDGSVRHLSITDAEVCYLANHLSRQVLNEALEVGSKSKIFEPHEKGLSLHSSFTNEIIESMGEHGGAITDVNEVKEMVKNLIGDAVKARLLLFKPDTLEHAYYIAMFVLDIFQSSKAYRSYEALIRSLTRSNHPRHNVFGQKALNKCQ